MKKIVIVLCLIMLLAVSTTAQAHSKKSLPDGYFVDSWRTSGGIIYAYLDADYGFIRLARIDERGLVELAYNALDEQAKPSSIGVNVCGNDVWLFIGWPDGGLQLGHWQIPDTLSECRKETLYLPLAGN